VMECSSNVVVGFLGFPLQSGILEDEGKTLQIKSHVYIKLFIYCAQMAINKCDHLSKNQHCTYILKNENYL